MKKPKYVIFDCDGVLVDSEILANRVEAEVKTDLGFPTTTEEQVRKFAGLSMKCPAILEEIARLPANYLEMVDEKLAGVFERELQPTRGIVEALHALRLPRCVASNSAPDWIARKLALTGIRGFFGDALYSGHQVKRGKPAPDLFLHAAERQGWAVEDCLVVEDSFSGVTAGKAAGMKVCAFVGGLHIFPGHVERLIEAGADYVISDMRRLLGLV